MLEFDPVDKIIGSLSGNRLYAHEERCSRHIHGSGKAIDVEVAVGYVVFDDFVARCMNSISAPLETIIESLSLSDVRAA